jgi:polar amino acid transport system substrate-binding protein
MTTGAARLAVVAVAALALTSCSSTAGGSSSSGDTLSLIKDGTLTVCTNPPYEPFEYEKDGKVVGLDISIVDEIAKDLGVKVETIVTPFEGIQSGEDLNSGKCDLVASGITITAEREAKMDFSKPYFDADQGVLVPADSGITSAEGLKGVKVGVQQTTTGETWAKDQGLDTAQFEDLGLEIEALRSGQIDAAINDVAALGPLANDQFVVGATFPTGEKYGFGVKTGNTALVTKVNASLDRITSDGTYDTIYQQFIGTAPAKS